MSNLTNLLRTMRQNKLFTISPTHLEYINALILTHVQPAYNPQDADKTAILFAHVHAMVERQIITNEELDDNFCDFVDEWRELLDDPDLRYDECIQCSLHPSIQQQSLTLELSLQVYNKEPIEKLKNMLDTVMQRRCEQLLESKIS